MATIHEKENVPPVASSDVLMQRDASPAKKTARKGRSKSIGPEDLGGSGSAKHDAKNRRKSTFIPATKPILSTDAEKAERQAARRRTLANRRVSFAPEATLHTWDVIEFMRDHTTSTDSSDQTRRQSNITRASSASTPFEQSSSSSSDPAEPPSTPPEQEDEPRVLPASPAQQRELHRQQHRRSVGSSPAASSSPNDGSPGDLASSSDGSGSEDEDGDEDQDATGTAMSLETDEATGQSSQSGSSTSSSLTQRLRQAAETAGTRGIEYDEHGDGTMSMELAEESVTNAFKPWAQRLTAEAVGSASLDQENVNPFSPAFEAQMTSGVVRRPSTIMEESTGDVSMDVTRAVGGIMHFERSDLASSPAGGDTMEFTQAVGRIQQSSPGSPTTRETRKRRRSTTDFGSPGAEVVTTNSKRSRRSSIARSSMGDDAMDLTMAIGGIQQEPAAATTSRRKSVARRRRSEVEADQEDATMELTQAVGGIKATSGRLEHTASSLDENEELTMELTTAIGGIKNGEKVASIARPETPQHSTSPLRAATNTTPKDQERFRYVPDSGPKKLLTPIFQKQLSHSVEKSTSSSKRRRPISPAKVSWTGAVFDEELVPHQNIKNMYEVIDDHAVAYPQLPSPQTNASPLRTPPRPANGDVFGTTMQDLLEAQLQQPTTPPSVRTKSPRSPSVIIGTPQQPLEPHVRSNLADSIKLMSTPRKETLKSVTPRKQALSQHPSPIKAGTSRYQPISHGTAQQKSSPARQLIDNPVRLQSNEHASEKVHLQEFLDQAGIRFMDITATKRRLTTAPTPSKARKEQSVTSAANGHQDEGVTLEMAVVTAACTQPEHDMFQHACHELKHYISEGKKVVKQLEAETYETTPPLIQAYMHASPDRKAALDAQMREMKTQARLRSKEIWYQWRTQLLADLTRGLSHIGEGLLRDDDVLARAEAAVDEVLPSLVEKKESLQEEAERLRSVAEELSGEDRAQLDDARTRLVEVEDEVAQKLRVLDELQREAAEYEQQANDLEETKAEFTAAIKEAERVREASRGISMAEIAALQDSIRALESRTGWSILSASSSPPTVTMTYRSSLQLYFHPAAFSQPSQTIPVPGHHNHSTNAPISLTYIAQDPKTKHPTPLTTTLRFFLQLLRAHLHALPQATTEIPDLLALVSSGWDAALAVAEAERRLSLETVTETRILSDEVLAVEAMVLLPKVRTKVRVGFEVAATVVGEDGGALLRRVQTQVQGRVGVVYGEQYHEGKMMRFVNERLEGGKGERLDWAEVVGELRAKLIATGAKGFRK